MSKAQFMQRAMRHGILESDAERSIALKAIAGNRSARDQLVRANLRLVGKIAGKYTPGNPQIDPEDLYQAGAVGLVEALDTYDPEKGTRFSTHATWRIRARVIRFVVYNKRLVRIKRGEQERLFYNVPAVAAQLSADGIDPTPEKIAEVLDADPKAVASIQARIKSGGEKSLNVPARGDGDSDGVDAIDLVEDTASMSGQTVEDLDWRLRVMDRIGSEIKNMRLSDRDAEIAKHRIRPNPVNVRDLADAVGCSRQTVCNVEQRINSRLKRRMVDLYQAL